MSDDTANDLLDSIDQLTKRTKTKIIQETIAGQHPMTVTIWLPPLLTQLEEAIRGSMVGIGGSGALANERNVLDSDALQRFLFIKHMIADWARIAGADSHPHDPAAGLRAWYVKYMQKPQREGSVNFYTRMVTSWVGEITAKLDPPRVRELPDPCPECKSPDWKNRSDGMRYLHPLVIEYRPTGPDMIQEAKARCRACEKTWGVRQLAYELEQTHSDTPEIAGSLQITTV